MQHINTTYLNTLKNNLHEYHTKRRDIINKSGDAQHHAKRAIFAMHRGDMKEADERLKLAGDTFIKLYKEIKKDARMLNEGSYRAGVEEYVEAILFHQFLTKGKVDKVPGLPIDTEVYLGGLCDVPGELYRYAIKSASEKNFAMVRQCAEMGEEIIGALIEFNLTSYLRNKFDQAKQAVHKLEIVVYEVSLRNEK